MDEIIEFLTDHHKLPIDRTFLWREYWIYINRPGSGILLRKFRNPPLSARCQEYLKATGAAFTTQEQLAEWAARHDWPNKDDLPDMTENED